jgi:phosphatidylglycerophosphate synthase
MTKPGPQKGSPSGLSALVIESAAPVTVGGLTLTERAVLIAARAGLAPVRVWAPIVPPGAGPLQATADRDEPVVIIGPNVLVEPAALADLVADAGRPGGAPARLVRDGGEPVLAWLSPAAVAVLRSCVTFDGLMADIAARWPACDRPLEGRFYRRVDRQSIARAAEREYLKHTNGGASESFFTKIIRRFSVPLSGWLVRAGVTPTLTTLAGLALAGVAAWCLAQGNYAAGVAGGVLYYMSMIFDCSDGEVARLTVRDSAFGAWLETIVDYVTYFLVLAGLTIASLNRPGADAQVAAAVVAVVGSLVVSIGAGYLRHRVAARNPGQFDESSARALASASPLHRFASWSRQWIKRSSVAHLLIALALVNQLSWLLYLWAFGATVATAAMLFVGPFVVRRVVVPPVEVRPHHVLR